MQKNDYRYFKIRVQNKRSPLKIKILVVEPIETSVKMFSDFQLYVSKKNEYPLKEDSSVYEVISPHTLLTFPGKLNLDKHCSKNIRA